MAKRLSSFVLYLFIYLFKNNVSPSSCAVTRANVRWLDQLLVHYPELGKKAISMNEQDGFQFKFRCVALYCIACPRLIALSRTQSKSSGCNTNVVGVNNVRNCFEEEDCRRQTRVLLVVL